MFQTIGHKGGFVQLAYFGNKETIKAWCHGTLLGEHYRTVAGAKAAITRSHHQWIQTRNSEHYSALQGIWKQEAHQ